jgi:tetratricopeptide (TPR) repeat protein
MTTRGAFLAIGCAGTLAIFAGRAYGQAADSAKQARNGAAVLQRNENAGPQSGAKSASGNVSATAKRGVDLAASGHCNEALPLLKKTMRAVADKELKYRAAMAAARCAMSVDQRETAVEALFLLNKEFPRDPQALYLQTHYFSQLASRASQELAESAPGSAQAHQLQAEGLESQGKWEEAAAEYRGILEKDPKTPGVHYRLGRIYLSTADRVTPESAANMAKAKEQFGEELEIDPGNAAAEFLLGEMARRNGEWETAIQHFAAASRKDAGFAEAFLALGMSLNSAQRFGEAVAPLESYAKMVPGDAAGHYQLSIAYSRTGRKNEAAREMAVQQELVRKNPNGVRSPE